MPKRTQLFSVDSVFFVNHCFNLYICIFHMTVLELCNVIVLLANLEEPNSMKLTLFKTFSKLTRQTMLFLYLKNVKFLLLELVKQF